MSSASVPIEIAHMIGQIADTPILHLSSYATFAILGWFVWPGETEAGFPARLWPVVEKVNQAFCEILGIFSAPRHASRGVRCRPLTTFTLLTVLGKLHTEKHSLRERRKDEGG